RPPSSWIAIPVTGLLLAIWSVTGAMNSFMTAVNIAYDCKDSRNFVKKRGLALLMASCIAFAFVLVAILLMLGPQIEKRIGTAVGHPSLVAYLWWIAQWPILVFGLLAAFATILYLGPDLAFEKRNWKLITPGAVVAVVAWLAVSGLFAFSPTNFRSYNNTSRSFS